MPRRRRYSTTTYSTTIWLPATVRDWAKEETGKDTPNAAIRQLILDMYRRHTNKEP